jgi:hypothetical protein
MVMYCCVISFFCKCYNKLSFETFVNINIKGVIALVHRITVVHTFLQGIKEYKMRKHSINALGSHDAVMLLPDNNLAHYMFIS